MSQSDEEKRPAKPFRDGLGKRRRLGVKFPPPSTPIYKPGDPRIRETLAHGGGVGVDLSALTPEGRKVWEEQARREFLGKGIRISADPVREANRLMQPDNERYPQEDEDGEG